jgi:hypothetical protein
MKRLIRNAKSENGSALVFVVISLLLLTLLGSGMLTAGYGARQNAVRIKNEAIARLCAEAGYEKAIFWMSQQEDMLNSLENDEPGTTGTLSFPGGSCNYQINFFSFVGYRPVYRIKSYGTSGTFNRTVDVFVVQAVSGWDMGQCRVPMGSTGTGEVYFSNNEVIDMPLNINNLNDNPDNRDIYIQGVPEFLQRVGMGEPRYTDGGADKYNTVMNSFEGGISFDQPDSKITSEDSVQSKVTRFKDSTKAEYTFTPTAKAPVDNPNAAVQLEFYVEDGVGKVRITNNCTVLGFKQANDSRTLDYKIQPGSDGTRFERYDIYAYHYMPEDAESTGERSVYSIEDTYVTQSVNGVTSEEGGQIFVNGNVVIGGDMTDNNGDQVVKGRITVVATGNVWIADSITVDGAHEADGRPSIDNPNILGLISQGVIKVVDPGLSEYPSGVGINNYPGPPDEQGVSHGGGQSGSHSASSSLNGFEYVPIGRSDGSNDYNRELPDPMIIEAAMTVGGGGWGAENVRRSPYGGRKEADGDQDQLIVRGTICEAIRGVVGLIDGDGYYKTYYFDKRLMEGILPGDLWLGGKFIPTPAGWHDYRVAY